MSTQPCFFHATQQHEVLFLFLFQLVKSLDLLGQVLRDPYEYHLMLAVIALSLGRCTLKWDYDVALYNLLYPLEYSALCNPLVHNSQSSCKQCL
jgi:hypothetical protein